MKENTRINITISKYVFTWIIAEPATGITTIKDAKELGLLRQTRKAFAAQWFTSKEKAQQHIQKLKQTARLTKEYRLYIITDAQYGKQTTDPKTGKTDFHPTSKQMKEAVIITKR